MSLVYKQHVTVEFLLQHVLELTAPVCHHLRQPNLLQVHDGPVDHVHRQSLHLYPDGGLQMLDCGRALLDWAAVGLEALLDKQFQCFFSSALTVRFREGGLCFKTVPFSEIY